MPVGDLESETSICFELAVMSVIKLASIGVRVTGKESLRFGGGNSFWIAWRIVEEGQQKPELKANSAILYQNNIVALLLLFHKSFSRVRR